MNSKHTLTLIEAWMDEKDEKEKDAKAEILLRYVDELDFDDKLQLLENAYEYTVQVVDRDTGFNAWRRKKEHMMREWELKLLSLTFVIGGLIFFVIWIYAQLVVVDDVKNNDNLKHVIDTIHRIQKNK